MQTREFLRALTSKGQVTVPKEIRERLKLEPGGVVRFRLDEAGDVTLSRAALSIDEIYGVVTPINRPEDFQALRDAAIEERVERKFRAPEQ